MRVGRPPLPDPRPYKNEGGHMSTGRRHAVLAGVIVAAIAVLVIARGGSDDKTTTTTTATTTTATKTTPKPSIPVHRITVKNAKPVGGIQQIKVNKGDQI